MLNEGVSLALETRLNWKELFILGLVWRGPIHGYEVKRIMALPPLASWVSISHSEIYHALNRLEKMGLTAKGVAKGRGATPFHLTGEGLQALKENVAFWLGSADNTAFGEFTTALKLAGVLSKEEICRALRRRKQDLLAQVAWVETTLHGDPPYPVERVCFGLTAERTYQFFVQSQFEWTDALLEQYSCATP